VQIEHRFEVIAACPVDARPDRYACTVRTGRVIKVEDILAAAAAFAGRAIFQEDLTRELHRTLAADVETIGWHSGVRTRVRIGGEG
jgi:heterodisulfide reductase subunit C